MEQRVRRHVADVIRGCSYEHIEAVDRFRKGDDHVVFKVSYTEPDGIRSAVVVRVGAVGETHDCSRAEREARILRMLDGHGAPRLLHFRCASHWLDTPTMCISYVPGDSKPFAGLDASHVEMLGRALAQVHLTDVSALGALLGETVSASAYLAERLATAVTARLDAAKEGLPTQVVGRITDAYRYVKDLVETAPANTAEAWDGASLVLLHGDPGEANVLWSPGPVLIEWEYARLGDPADEIAYTFMDNRSDRPQRDALLRGYRAFSADATSRPIEARIKTWGPVNLLGSAMWWIERYLMVRRADQAAGKEHSSRRPADQYLRGALDRLDRFEPLFNAARKP
jgi:aminoglycoside phosphotransferase (APT) family kinase protein